MTEATLPGQLAEWFMSIERRLARIEGVADFTSVSALRDVLHDASDEAEVTEGDIRAAYRLLLDREPDPGGFATYRERAANGLSRADLVTELLDSDERAALRTGNIVEIDVGGVTVCIDKTESEFGRAIARDGVWEAHIVAQLQAHLSPGAVFVDIGANVGVMSFHAAKSVGAAGKVIVFEPNPENVQHFLQGVLANGFEHIRLLPMAASATNSVFAIKGGSNSHVAPAIAGRSLAASVRADDMLAGETRIDVIKIDIEGHEPMALDGLAMTLARHRPLIVCEFNPRCLRATAHIEPEAFAGTLFDLASSIEIIEHDGGLTAVRAPSELMARWAHRNAEHVVRGDLPDGMVHFDLLIRCARNNDNPADQLPSHEQETPA